jgi:hypothetical protein
MTVDTAEGVRDLTDQDIEELIKITDELARRVNPSINTDTDVI